MEMLQTILGQLNINTTVFTQFITVFALFIVAKYLFYSKLQEVLEQRHEQTTGLESQADATFEKVEALKEEYENKMSGARLKASQQLKEAKQKIIAKFDEKYGEREKIVENRIEEANQKISGEVNSQKESLLGQSQNLADDLVAKILQ